MTKQSNSTLVKRFNIGLVSISIWHKQNDHGDFYHAAVTRNYKDRDGNWKNGSNFDLQELLSLQHMLGSAIITLSAYESNQAESQETQEEAVA